MIRWYDDLSMWVAWRLPRRVAMWASVRVAAHAAAGEWANFNPQNVTIIEMLERWKKEV